jgi:flagellar hook assembly protein FlgD
VSLAIYNLRGQRVRQLLDEMCTTGTHKLEWAGTDDNDRVVPSGVYLARMQADGSNLSQRLLLVK